MLIPRHAIAGIRCNPARSWCCYALALALGTAATCSNAAICKYVDAEGNVYYSNVAPDRGMRKLSCEGSDDTAKRGAAGSAPARGTPTPSGFPRVDADTQKSRDDLRRKVLGEELSSEEKLLAEARVAYANGAPSPLPEEQANAERYRERIGRLRQSVQLHERNIEALKKELGSGK